MDLDQVFPCPVAVPFGGANVLAAPLTLRQLGAIQRWLRAAIPHPIDAARAELLNLDGAELRRRAGELLRAGEELPVRIFTPAGDALIASDAGRTFLAVLALGELNPHHDVAGLAETATDAEWSGLARVLYGTDPVAELIRTLDPDPDGGSGEPTNWGRIVADMAQGSRSLAEIGSWTLGQLAAVRHKGERVGLTPRPRDDESLADAAARRRAALGIPDEPPDEANDPEMAEVLRNMDRIEELRRRGV